ncbi:MAG: aldehyde ferredoxin oxidoreductase family protein [Chloroflexota bacterium]
MNLGGYANRIAHIDLTAKKIDVKPIPEEWALKYIGARGLGVRYMLENGPEVDPLSPDNLLCFMNGPLTGTAANMSGRMAIVTKSPLTGTVTDSHHGGWSAARLRWSGYDGLIFKGKAEKPVYVYIHDDEIEILDAAHLWGKGIHETIAHFRELYGEKDLTVMAIGPAGENLVRYGCWVNEDDRASGRGGTGCVGGSKNLKAVVVKAKKKFPKPQNPDAWKPAHREVLSMIMDEKNITSPRKGGLSVYGTNVLMNITSNMGALPAYNARVTSFGDRAENISGEYVKENILIKDPTCHACPVACKKEVLITEGEFAGTHMESFEYEPAWALGANCGNDNAASIAKMIQMANDLGMDAIEIGDVLGTYIEATEQGFVNGDGGLKSGDYLGMIEALKKVAHREGIGNILADGINAVAAHYQHPEIAMSVKGQGIPAYDPRGMKGMGIAYATSNRGACHLRAYTPASELGLIPLQTDPLEWKGKGELTKLLQDIHAFSDSLDLCKFSAFAEGAEEYANQYSAMVGVPFTMDDVLVTGERIYNLERHYNNLAGLREGSDYLPKRFLEEPSTMPGSEGHVCELDLMLEEYYTARGWENGVVPESKLQELEVV